MIRPSAFGFDSETATTNPFQAPSSLTSREVAARGRDEFDRVVAALTDAGVEIIVVDDARDPRTPDAVFPNNWISTHHDGTVVLYPMLATNRRLERRYDVVARLRQSFAIRRLVDLSPNEEKGRFLEGTGSVVFDHPNRTAYAGLSPRTDRGMLYEIEELLGYEIVAFRATDALGDAIYHTNVVLTIGDRFTIVCSEAIGDADQRRQILTSLASTGREILEITRKQMTSFAANLLELRAAGGQPVLAGSESAWIALSREQQVKLESLARVVRPPIPTIEEVGGGSVRCMIAEVFLPAAENLPD